MYFEGWNYCRLNITYICTVSLMTSYHTPIGLPYMASIVPTPYSNMERSTATMGAYKVTQYWFISAMSKWKLLKNSLHPFAFQHVMSTCIWIPFSCGVMLSIDRRACRSYRGRGDNDKVVGVTVTHLQLPVRSKVVQGVWLMIVMPSEQDLVCLKWIMNINNNYNNNQNGLWILLSCIWILHNKSYASHII